MKVLEARSLIRAPTGGGQEGGHTKATAMCRFWGQTHSHDSGGVPQIRDPSESDRSGKMGSTAQDLLVLEFLVLGQ